MCCRRRSWMLRFENWTAHQWARFLMQAGWLLFGIACLNSARLPAEALLIGPATMAAGVAMCERDKRGPRRQRDSGQAGKEVQSTGSATLPNKPVSSQEIGSS